jgi:hypothetical protein
VQLIGAARLLAVTLNLLCLTMKDHTMSTDNSPNVMQLAMIKAGILTEDRAEMFNQIKKDKDRKAQRKNKQNNRQQIAENNNVTRFRINLRRSA